MVVPYGDPKFRYWQAYFDSGEYLVGKWVNSLERGCDCLGEITYLDAVIPRRLRRAAGESRTAICIHEEDHGILWKHTPTSSNGSAQSAAPAAPGASRSSTLSATTTTAFYWYFYLDGTIECEVKMTGTLFTAAHPGGDYPYSAEVAPGLGAPVHQHLFGARAGHDGGRDGQRDRRGRRRRLPRRASHPYGNAIRHTVTRLATESAAVRRADGAPRRTWRVISTERVNQVRPADRLHPLPAGRACAARRSFLVDRRPELASRPTTCGSPSTTRPTVTRLVTSSTSIRAAPGCHAFIARDQDTRRRGHRGVAPFGPVHFPAS